MHSRPRLCNAALGSLAACMLWAGAARADGFWADCLRDASSSGHIYYQYFAPATLFVGRDTQVGDVIGPWMTAPNPTAWRCAPLPLLQSAGSVQLTVQGYPPYVREGTVDSDGQAYAMYWTNDPSLGYIARWRFTVNGQTSDWQPLTIATGGQQTPPTSFPITYNGGHAFFVGADVQIRLVRRQATALPAMVTIFDPMYLRHVQTDGSQISYGTLTYRIAQLLPNTVALVAGGTCTTPDVSVVFPSVSSGAFNGIGSTAATTPFNLAFSNCPAGYQSIGYSFAPTTSIVDAAQGVVALAPPSTAAGIGVQLARGDGTPVTFGTVYPLTEYNPAQEGSYLVPMQAALYQTGATVTPGTVRSSVTFTLDYR
ncbi:fimbrial protein [Bordetella petrii]|uniref:fimbrial protein n=1 Tax=Bordetella petrii TaxID=94624 RepID=UPI001E496A27|nr:fimbrial protein [Bordetella petrii]MCD0502950.1 type 1 fimbrial protein [Bordetella petrii]